MSTEGQVRGGTKILDALQLALPVAEIARPQRVPEASLSLIKSDWP